MNVQDAAYHTVHDYPGGSESLGPRVGVKPAVLRNKVNWKNPANHLTLDEAQLVMVMSGDHRIVYAQLDELGYLPPVKRIDFLVSDSALLESFTRLMSELGDFSGKFHVALSDGKLTSDEVDRMEDEMREVYAAAGELLSRMRQIAED